MAALDERAPKLAAISGVGSITALAALVELPELGTLNRRQVAALAGVAQHLRQSGSWQGRRNFGAVRRRCGQRSTRPRRWLRGPNPTLRTFYLRLRAAGKPAKAALTAVMPKLVILINDPLKNPHFELAT